MIAKSIIIAISCAFLFCCSIQASENFRIIKDGKRIGIDLDGILEGGKIFLDVNSISKSLGVSVKMVSEKLMVLCVADRCVPVEMNEKKSDTMVKGKTTFVSAEVLASVLGCKYEYNAKNKTLSLRRDNRSTSAYKSNKGVQIGLPLSDFTLHDINGKLVSLRDFRGKRAAILTWASW